MSTPKESKSIEEPISGESADIALSKSWSVGKLRPYLHLLAARRISDPNEVSDAVQQTLIQAWQNESKAEFNSTAERLAWLRTILVHTIRRRHRDRNTLRRGGRIPHESLAETRYLAMAQQVAAVTNPLVRAEESLQLSEAIDKLPDDQRHVIVRHQFDDADYSAIAEELNRSVEATRMLKVRALQSLRKILMQP